MAWKQSLYAFLLRRFLGPFLTSDSNKKLSSSIEFSLQEGRFSLQNISLDPSYLTNLINGIGDISVQKASVRKLTIDLSIHSIDHNGDNKNSSEQSDVGTVSTMRKIIQLRNRTRTMSLFASIHIEGLEIFFSPSSSTNPSEKNKIYEKKNMEEYEKDGGEGYFSSAVDAAMSSLRLGITMKDIHFRFYDRPTHGSPQSWLSLSVTSLSYRDLTPMIPETSHSLDFETGIRDKEKWDENDEDSMMEVLRKEFEIIGLSTQISSNRNPTSAINILHTEGICKIQIRACTTNSEVQNDQESDQQKITNPMLYNELTITLQGRIIMNFDAEKIQRVQTVLQSFAESLKQKSDSSIPSEKIEIDNIHTFDESSKCVSSTHTAEGIMRQYAEARHFARTREIRGGMLLPTSFGEDENNKYPIDDDESMEELFDTFFDCNETSFSHYLSFVQTTPVLNGQKNNDCVDLFHTKINFHVLEGSVKLLFHEDKDGSKKRFTKTNTPCDEQYLLISYYALDINATIAETKKLVSLQFRHFEVEDAMYISSTSLIKKKKVLDTGQIIRFTETSNLDGRLIMDGPPCISVSILSGLNVKDSDCMSDDLAITVAIEISPVEVTFREKTLKNIIRLMECIQKQQTSSCSQPAGLELSPPPQKSSYKVSFSCPKLNVFMPMDPETISSRDLEALFLRAGHYVRNITLQPMIGVTFVSLSSKFTTSSTFSFVSEYCTLFVISPSFESENSIVLEIISLSGNPTISGESTINLHYSDSSGVANESTTFSFPLVPPLSSVKTRQDTTSDQTIRGGDPQGMMLNDTKKCDSDLNIQIPLVIMDISLTETKCLMKILNAINASNANNKTENSNMIKKESPSQGRCIGIGLNCEQITLSVHDTFTVENSRKACTFFLVIDHFKLHAVIHDSHTQNLRTLCHNISLYEATPSPNVAKSKSTFTLANQQIIHGKKIRSRGLSGLINAVPILYRSNLSYPLSPETPGLLLDVIKSKDEEYPNDRTIYFSLYDMTYRYSLDSECCHQLSSILQECCNIEKETKNDISPPVSNTEENEPMVKLFVNFSDSVIDYCSSRNLQTPSRSLIRVGEMRLSCNLVSCASVQAYKISVADVTVHMGNWRFPYNEENSRLSCSRQIMNFEDIDTSQIPVNLSKLRYASFEEVLDHMNFVCVANLDSVDAMVRKVVDTSIGWKEDNAQPSITVNLTMGKLSLYTCKDSFACMTKTINEWLLNFTALSDEEIASLKASAQATLQINDEISNTDLVSKSVHDVENKATIGNIDITKTESQLNLLDIIQEDMFSEISSSSSPITVSSESYEKNADKIKIASPFTNVPDNELSATELRKKHNINSIDESVSKITETLLIKNFYTIKPKSPSLMENEKEVDKSTTKRRDSCSQNVEDDDWTTVDHSWSRHSQLEGHDQKAIWFPDENGSGENSEKSSAEIKIFPQHIPVSRTRDDPFLEKNMNTAKYAGTEYDPKVALRILLTDFNLNCRLFDGCDWINCTKHGGDWRNSNSHFSEFHKSSQNPKQALMEQLLSEDSSDVGKKCFKPLPSKVSHRKARQNNRFLQFSFQGIKLRMDSLTESNEHFLASCMRLKINDFSFVETISDFHPKKMLGAWINEEEHPRDFHEGMMMLKMVSMRPTCKVSVDGKIMSDESVAKLDLRPLRCHINQLALQFVSNFFSSEDSDESLEDSKEGSDDIQVIGTFFKAFKVTHSKVKVNYNPVHIDMAALKNGSYLELLNLFPLEGMELNLQPVEIQNVIGWGVIFSELVSSWLEDIAASQVHKFITGATPFHSITSVGEGMADMVLIPVHEFKYGGSKHVGRAVRESTSKFAGTVVVEALDNTSKLTKHLALGLTECVPRTSSSNRQSVSFFPSRPETAPHNVGQTLEHAYESVSKGLRAANYTIVVIPRKEYQRNGAAGAMKSVIKAIPVAVLAPLSGASEAISYSLLGMRNQLRPDLRKEEEESRRGI